MVLARRAAHCLPQTSELHPCVNGHGFIENVLKQVRKSAADNGGA